MAKVCQEVAGDELMRLLCKKLTKLSCEKALSSAAEFGKSSKLEDQEESLKKEYFEKQNFISQIVYKTIIPRVYSKLKNQDKKDLYDEVENELKNQIRDLNK